MSLAGPAGSLHAARCTGAQGKAPAILVVPVVVIVELLPAEVLELAALTMFPVELVVASSDEARRGDDVEIEQPDRRAEESLEVGASCWSVTEHQAEEPDPVKDEVAVAVRVTSTGSVVQELRDEGRVLLLVPLVEVLLSCCCV